RSTWTRRACHCWRGWRVARHDVPGSCAVAEGQRSARFRIGPFAVPAPPRPPQYYPATVPPRQALGRLKCPVAVLPGPEQTTISLGPTVHRARQGVGYFLADPCPNFKAAKDLNEHYKVQRRGKRLCHPLVVLP